MIKRNKLYIHTQSFISFEVNVLATIGENQIHLTYKSEKFLVGGAKKARQGRYVFGKFYSFHYFQALLIIVVLVLIFLAFMLYRRLRITQKKLDYEKQDVRSIAFGGGSGVEIDMNPRDYKYLMKNTEASCKNFNFLKFVQKIKTLHFNLFFV